MYIVLNCKSYVELGEECEEESDEGEAEDPSQELKEHFPEQSAALPALHHS